MSATDTASLPDYAPLPQTAVGPALNEQGYYVGRVERNLYYVTDGTYQCAFLTTSDGVVVLDAPPTLGHNIQRAIDEIAAANGVSNKVEYLVYSHHHSDHVGAASLFDKNVTRIGHEEIPGLTTLVTARTSGPRPEATSSKPRLAAEPVIEKYTGVLAGADIFTESTAFWVMESIRLDLGYGSQVHP